MLKKILPFLLLLILSTGINSETITTDNLLTNSTFGTQTTYSNTGWTISGYDGSHNYTSLGGGNDPGGSFASGKDSSLSQSITLIEDADMLVEEVQSGWSSTLSSDIWYWNNYDNTTTLKQTITGSDGSSTTQQRVIIDTGCGSINCGQFTNYTDTYIQGSNTQSDYTIGVNVSNNNSRSGHYGPDIDDIKLNISYTQYNPITEDIQDDFDLIDDFEYEYEEINFTTPILEEEFYWEEFDEVFIEEEFIEEAFDEIVFEDFNEFETIEEFEDLEIPEEFEAFFTEFTEDFTGDFTEEEMEILEEEFAEEIFEEFEEEIIEEDAEEINNESITTAEEEFIEEEPEEQNNETEVAAAEEQSNSEAADDSSIQTEEETESEDLQSEESQEEIIEEEVVEEERTEDTEIEIVEKSVDDKITITVNDNVSVDIKEVSLFDDGNKLTAYSDVSFYQPENIYTNVDNSFFIQTDLSLYNKGIYLNIGLDNYISSDPVSQRDQRLYELRVEKIGLMIELRKLKELL